MNPTLNAARAGLSRGWIEFRASLTNPQELLFGYLLTPAIFIVIALFLEDERVEGSEVTVATLVLVGGLAMLITMLGVTTVAQVLATEREDGTLLRAKATPHGMVGYTVGKIWHLLTMSVLALALLLVPGMLFVDGFVPQGVVGVFTLVWVCALGLLALAPVGAVLGALITNPKTGIGIVTMPILGLVMISGVFFPMDLMPGWVQVIALAFPVYWTGLGLRAALMPADYAALELAGSWQLPQVAGVLVLWAVVGFAVAQWVLRRTARRESGSKVQAAREKAVKRAY